MALRVVVAEDSLLIRQGIIAVLALDEEIELTAAFWCDALAIRGPLSAP